jgi:IS605 OrfB family transposase
MRRACKVTLKYLTDRKQCSLAALLESYRAAVNFYITSLWKEPGKLDKDTLQRLKNTRLSERYKSQALKQALEIVISTKRSLKANKKWGKNVPKFKGNAILDAKFVSVEKSKNLKDFDLVIRLSCLKKGFRIDVPTKKTKVLNKWVSHPNAQFIQGCSLSEHSLTLWVQIPDQEIKEHGEKLGVDIGVNKLLSLSDGSHLGTEFKQIRDKINRKKSKSKAKKRALKERDNFIRQECNKLPWKKINFLAIEKLKDLKKGKKKNRGKTFRKAMVPWTYRQVIGTLEQKAQEHRVDLVCVEPAYTSQRCPSCEKVSRNNRHSENFCCVDCGYSQDADSVGAMNILVSGLRLVGSLESPMLLESKT